MSTITGTEEFVALLCSDEELLRAEFDAIIAAEWPSVPPTLPGSRVGVGHPPPTAGFRWFVSNAWVTKRPLHPRIGGRARQRSPPPVSPAESGELVVRDDVVNDDLREGGGR